MLLILIYGDCSLRCPRPNPTKMHQSLTVPYPTCFSRAFWCSSHLEHSCQSVQSLRWSYGVTAECIFTMTTETDIENSRGYIFFRSIANCAIATFCLGKRPVLPTNSTISV